MRTTAAQHAEALAKVAVDIQDESNGRLTATGGR